MKLKALLHSTNDGDFKNRCAVMLKTKANKTLGLA